MLRIPIHMKLAGAGAAGLMLAGGAAANAAGAFAPVTLAVQPAASATAAPARPGVRHRHPGRRIVARAEADVLGITPKQLRADLLAGISVHDLAQRQGMNREQFVDKLVPALQARLAKLVAAGKITQAQADALVTRVQHGWVPFWELPRGWHPRTPAGTPSTTASPAATPAGQSA